MDDRSAIPRTLKEMWADKGCLFTGFIMFMIFSAPIYSAFYPSPEAKKKIEELANIERKEDVQRAATGGFTYQKFELKGHTYISFYRRGVHGHWTVVHDPDCLCWMEPFYSDPLLPPTN